MQKGHDLLRKKEEKLIQLESSLQEEVRRGGSGPPASIPGMQLGSLVPWSGELGLWGSWAGDVAVALALRFLTTSVGLHICAEWLSKPGASCCGFLRGAGPCPAPAWPLRRAVPGGVGMDRPRLPWGLVP